MPTLFINPTTTSRPISWIYIMFLFQSLAYYALLGWVIALLPWVQSSDKFYIDPARASYSGGFQPVTFYPVQKALPSLPKPRTRWIRITHLVKAGLRPLSPTPNPSKTSLVEPPPPSRLHSPRTPFASISQSTSPFGNPYQRARPSRVPPVPNRP
ncbi:hypothetical protein H4R33_005914 [Dimargaris cristalligena]|uniref:Uncharacterized protein n=1 Tax=Dimargaris cristalligena TaxID=215637 RepID=A0A4P9ZPR8_9FUNG|nr:hypothetical protein H4R33_005914 [Dimargaris cristalligena]RKP34340.1 hypothetical protein BJ085DRAFT_34267 [Dimargaris cristalligena]|eukprot:RKP34340.1 hypothetical protein BJ085DRAFT_34267 [Dimargaris cristalligena]